MLFTLWSSLPSAVVDDAQSLSFATLVEQWISDLVRFMEGAAFDGWDSAPAGQLHIWYSTSMKALRQSDPLLYLFDPTILLLNLILHLQSTLQSRHHFVINKPGKGKSSALIPLDFIREWRDDLLKVLGSDTATVRALLTPSTT